MVRHEITEQDKDYGELDLPLLAWKCFTAGVLVVGVADVAFIFPVVSIFELKLQWQFILGGVTNLILACILFLLASIYWWLVTRKTGAIFGKALMLSPILCALTLISGMFIGAIITYAISALI